MAWFYFVVCCSNNRVHTFEASSSVCDKIVRLRKSQYLLDTKKSSHPADYFYLQTSENKCFPNTVGDFKIRVDIFIRLSCNIVLAFDLKVSRTNAKAFKGHLLHLMQVEWDVDNKSTTSTPPFSWSCIAWTLGFFLWYLVTFTLSCIEDKAITFFFPDFFLSI